MPFTMTDMPRRKCLKCGAEMEFQNDMCDEPVQLLPPGSDQPIPAELWICHRCNHAYFYASANT